MRYAILIFSLGLIGCSATDQYESSDFISLDYFCSTRQELVDLINSSDAMNKSKCIKITNEYKTLETAPNAHLGGIRPVKVRNPDGAILDGWMMFPQVLN